MRPFALAAALLLGLLSATPARATDDAGERAREEQARSCFASGARHFHDGDYEGAIAAFQAGYRHSPQPLFLFNIAQAARKSGQIEMAIDYYDQYLQREPSRAAPQRAEAEQQLIRLRRRSAPPPPTNAPSALEPRPVAPPPSLPPPTAATAPALEPAPAIARTQSPTHRSARSHAWIWGTVAGVVVVGAGVGLWVGLQPRGPEHPSLGSVTF
jgi:tetratricopeptide (TPR) repeat protein